MKHQFGHELQHGTHLIGRTLGWMVVACVDGEDDVVLGCVGGIEIVTANCEALQSDAEHLSLDTVFHHWLRLGKNLVERVFEVMTIEEVVDALVLASIVYPQVHDTGVALCLSDGVGDVATAARVLNPEVSDAVVRIGETEVSALGMRETGAVEVEFGVVLLSPVDPTLEVGDVDLITVNDLPFEVAINLVEIQTVVARNEALCLQDVGTQLVDVTSLTRIVTCTLDAT